MSKTNDNKITRPIKVTLVDDDKSYIDSLKKKIFTNTPLKLYKEYYSGREFIQSLDSPFQPDVCLIDLVLNDMQGIECCKMVKEKRPDIHIILMTSYPSLSSVLQIRNMDADYIEKGERIESIVENIIRSYKKSDSERIISVRNNTFGDMKNMELIDKIEQTKKVLSKLTESQRKIFELKTKGHTRKEIADELGISTSTVNTQINRALKKLTIPDILKYLFE